MGRRQRLLLTGLSGGWIASLAPGYRRFTRALSAPQAAQDRLLRAIVAECADAAQGRELGLSAVTDLESYQDRVPVRSYEDYRPYVDRIANGEAAVLTRSPVRMLERSSGSTGGDKLIPYTEGLLGDFSAATAPWLFSLYAARPALFGTTSYWSVSPAARPPETTPGGLPVGFEDDTAYFSPVERWALSRLLSVPGSVARAESLEAWRRATVRRLLADADLGFVSVWSPTFLTLLMEAVKASLPDVLPTLPRPRARAIRQALDRAGDVTGPALWPRLRLVSCWTDGHAARFLEPVRRAFPGVEIQPKGLLATEGVVSFPLTPLGPGEPPAEGSVAAITSHLLELVDLEHPGRRPRPVHRARTGATYAPLLSTRGGLLRYHLRDQIRCVGFTGGAPRFRFEGKLDRTSDLCGEKITAGDAERAIARAEAAAGGPFAFALLAPEARPPRYRLFVEGAGDLERAAEAAEAALAEGHHYRYARDLGQLSPVVATRITDGARRFEARLVAEGMRAGDIKPTPLDNRLFWAETFDGS